MATTALAANSPLAWFFESEVTTRRILARAKAQLTEACLRSKGFDDVRLPVLPDPTISHISTRYGNVDVETARRFGFSNLEASEVDTQAAASDSKMPDSEAFRTALEGNPQEFVSAKSPIDDSSVIGSYQIPDGCSGETLIRLFGTMDAATRYQTVEVWLQQIEQSTLLIAQSDSHVLDRIADWRSCMENMGYKFESPMDASVAVWNSPETEKAAAVASAECQASSGYLDALVSADSAAQTQILENAGDVLGEFRMLRDELVRRCESVLIDGSGK